MTDQQEEFGWVLDTTYSSIFSHHSGLCTKSEAELEEEVKTKPETAGARSKAETEQ